MDIKKVGNLDPMQKPANQPGAANKIGGGPSFDEILNGVPAAGARKVDAPKMDGVKFSNHAVERMVSRGIKFGAEDMQKLNEAIGRAASKGSKDSLILMNDAALIVSVKNKTVVTVMDKSALKENVFTNIDSTIVM
jgi:flagellar operon protein